MSNSAVHPASQLPQEMQAVQSLLEVLKQEQQHLVDANIDGVMAVTEEKSKAAGRLTDLSLARHQALANAGFAASEDGMQQWLEAQDGASASAGTQAGWAQLLQLMRTAREMNRTNGALINTHLGRTQAALNVLQGSTPGNSFYGPDGQSSVRPVGRGLVVG